MSAETSSKTILLVDDDTTLQALMSMVFRANGLEVYTADNGRQATEVLEKTAVDLIVLDMMMPVMDGLKFLDWLRSSRMKGVPVLAVTGMERPGSKEEILQAGATHVSFKPVDVPSLLGKIKQLLGM